MFLCGVSARRNIAPAKTSPDIHGPALMSGWVGVKESYGVRARGSVQLGTGARPEGTLTFSFVMRDNTYPSCCPSSTASAIAGVRGVAGNYRAGIGARLLQGRELLPSDSAQAPPVVVATDDFAKRYVRSANTPQDGRGRLPW